MLYSTVNNLGNNDNNERLYFLLVYFWLGHIINIIYIFILFIGFPINNYMCIIGKYEYMNEIDYVSISCNNNILDIRNNFHTQSSLLTGVILFSYSWKENKLIEYDTCDQRDLLCLLCNTNKINILCDPCKHVFMCKTCSINKEDCYICEKKVDKVFIINL
jgi:hypothetical protein